ncbi:decapping enzyme complex catalytic subunit SCDLUD_002889 [Saccharomycodes ludwigii]|uniref:decapping enzyme complex catalytic subunit n=1 Tax=Saccharomycodes ludwigii TaxID=36035 RepID=UPI001E8B6F02|nr:hypothetical protein SCDLUD_002889 [Saccharomycodes ludwigii]KAH3901397.1 hypothetical protein SCDLUD_002889 [Saccharomycodes ludwigii]
MSLPLRNPLENITTLDRALEDLLVRFIINCPEEDLSSEERVLFQFEEAHWFYADFIKILNPKTLPNLKIKNFASKIIELCPLIWKWTDETADEALQKFSQYKKTIPVRGAAIFNEHLNKMLLVKGTESESWSFPRGKISKDENDVDCCIREVMEETGFDLTDYIDENEYVQRNIGGKNYKIFLVSGVPENFPFKPLVRHEIEDIKWKDFKKLVKSIYNNNTNVKFYLVNAMIRSISLWIKKQRQIKGDDRLKIYVEEQLKILLGLKKENVNDPGRELLNMLHSAVKKEEINGVSTKTAAGTENVLANKDTSKNDIHNVENDVIERPSPQVTASTPSQQHNILLPSGVPPFLPPQFSHVFPSMYPFSPNNSIVPESPNFEVPHQLLTPNNEIISTVPANNNNHAIIGNTNSGYINKSNTLPMHMVNISNESSHMRPPSTPILPPPSLFLSSSGMNPAMNVPLNNSINSNIANANVMLPSPMLRPVDNTRNDTNDNVNHVDPASRDLLNILKKSASQSKTTTNNSNHDNGMDSFPENPNTQKKTKQNGNAAELLGILKNNSNNISNNDSYNNTSPTKKPVILKRDNITAGNDKNNEDGSQNLLQLLKNGGTYSKKDAINSNAQDKNNGNELLQLLKNPNASNVTSNTLIADTKKNNGINVSESFNGYEDFESSSSSSSSSDEDIVTDDEEKEEKEAQTLLDESDDELTSIINEDEIEEKLKDEVLHVDNKSTNSVISSNGDYDKPEMCQTMFEMKTLAAPSLTFASPSLSSTSIEGGRVNDEKPKKFKLLKRGEKIDDIINKNNKNSSLCPESSVCPIKDTISLSAQTKQPIAEASTVNKSDKQVLLNTLKSPSNITTTS